MKPEKMTPETLAGIVKRMESGETMTAVEQRAALAHIAAVEAERDAVTKMLDALGVPTEADEQGSGRVCDLAGRVRLLGNARDNLTTERDALRERVQALEAKQATLDEHYKTACADASRYEGMLRTAESRLAAIRQRAEHLIEAGRPSWVDAARYVVGEDAAGAAHEHRYRADGWCDCGATVHEAPELTTEEAFATVGEGLERGAGTYVDNGAQVLGALSLLERRMGAMGRAARLACEDWEGDEGTTYSHAFPGLMRDLRAALTDAPRVYSEEEVEEAMRNRDLRAGDVEAVLYALRNGA